MKVGLKAHLAPYSLPLPENPSNDSDEKIGGLKRLISSQGESSPKRRKEERSPGIYDAEGRILYGKIRHQWDAMDYYGELTPYYIDLNGKFAHTTQENRLHPEKRKPLTLFTGLYYNSATKVREEGTFLVVDKANGDLITTKLSSTTLPEEDFTHFRSIVEESGARKTGLFHDDKLRWGLLEHPKKGNRTGKFDDQERFIDGKWNYSYEGTYGFTLTGTFTYATDNNRTVTTCQGEMIHRQSQYAKAGTFTIEELFLVYCQPIPVLIDPMDAPTQELREDLEKEEIRVGQFYENGRLKQGKITYDSGRIYEGEFGPTERLIYGKRFYPEE
ncbi:MAG: hypothetical protein ACK5MA_11465, partial [Parachlamydiaceae bacterium]